MTSPYENIYPKSYQFCCLLTKCCFCIPLRTGCFILGYISLILNFIITLFFIGTLAFLAVYTHGFRYIYTKQNENGENVPDEDSMDSSKLNSTVAIIILVGCLNVGWFVMNIVLLVGLHRKRPGHIKLHVCVATIRLVLSIAGVLIYGAHTTNSMLVCCMEIALSGYFILLYYVYAVQLEREQTTLRQIKPEIRPVSQIVRDVIFNYPQAIDKVTLTNKDEHSTV
ncbi:uncharacterized protein LOC124635718 [Helicoverpa zea]|uniref:uncharacterized protein LOC124635718 n=1 Tax=Helicoverpa zea TaxID=7113 RepID=UPI001F586FAB|nr:uncharacterized protein LOC124635718 [Helicoverpa zea]